jgi:hypothetical protein
MRVFTHYLFKKLEKKESCRNIIEVNGIFREAISGIDLEQ